MDASRPTPLESADVRRAQRLPPGQTQTRKFPVLTYGMTPRIATAEWKMRAFGAVRAPQEWGWEEFVALGRRDVRADFHCVTSWSRLDNLWTGVPTRTFLQHVDVDPGAAFVVVHGYGDYTTNMPLVVFADEDCLFATHHDRQPLEREHGGPMRLVVPKRYAWKSAKWVNGVEFAREDRPGFWEQNGYSNSADPWREERYW